MLADLRKEFPSSLVLTILLVLGFWYLLSGTMKLYPSYVHAWTQSDRIAIAQNFQENGFDFFHPSTYNLLTKDGVTQVDFPIHDYLVALISEAFSTSPVTTFRWYNLIYTWLGLLFLFRLGMGIGLSRTRSVFACLFIATLPFWVFYQNGFLPSNPSLANLFIALYYFQNYWKRGHSKFLIFSFLFFTLSALARAPFLIYTIAGIALLFVRQIQWKKLLWKEILIGFISLGVFLAYWFYNRYLGMEYGSMFLGDILPINSLSDFKYVFGAIAERWADDLLSPFHGIILLIVLIQVAKTKVKKVNALFLWLLFSSLGTLVFFALFGLQFVDHDYYYIDSFLPILTVFLLLLLKRFQLNDQWYSPFALMCFIFSFYFYSYAADNMKERYSPKWDDRVHYAYESYVSAADQLADWGVQKEDTLCILEANSTNIPFTIWGNKGYTSLNSQEDSVKSILKKKSDYVVLVDSFFRLDAFRDYPDLINRLSRVGGNGEISFYELKEQGIAKPFFEHFYYYRKFDFDNYLPDTSKYGNYVSINQEPGKENHVHVLNQEIEYGLTYSSNLNLESLEKDLHIILLADFYQVDEMSKMQIVCQFGEHYFPHYLESTLKSVNQWDYKQYRYKIPAEKLKSEQEVKIYFWNQLKKEVYIDNYHLLIYQ